MYIAIRHSQYFPVCIKDLCELNFYIFFPFTVDLFLAIPVYVLYISDCICSVYMALALADETSISK